MSSSCDCPDLPDDVVRKILKRLPVRSLLRFRCVSRSWRSAIDHCGFVADHMDHSVLDASNWHTMCIDLRGPLQKVLSLFSELHLQLPFPGLPKSYGFVGSCNGLICVSENSKDCRQTMYLWNPFTRQHKAVRPFAREHQFLSVKTTRVAAGFGFDARSRDYKIVRIIYFPDDKHRCFGGTKPRVEIYSLRTDSWRSMECEVTAPLRDYKAVFLNGNLHWFAFKYDEVWEEGGYGSIVSFDVEGEVFDEMALPEAVSHTDKVHLMMSMAILNDLLAVFISFMDAAVDPQPHSVCSVWVMREYGVPESWSQLYTFKACGELTRFDGFTKYGELVMKTFPGKRIIWNPITGQQAEIPQWLANNIVTVVESLVHFRDDSIDATFIGNAD